MKYFPSFSALTFLFFTRPFGAVKKVFNLFFGQPKWGFDKGNYLPGGDVISTCHMISDVVEVLLYARIKYREASKAE